MKIAFCLLSLLLIVVSAFLLIYIKKDQNRTKLVGSIEDLEIEREKRVRAVQDIDQNIQIEKGVYDDIILKTNTAKEQYSLAQTKLEVAQEKINMAYDEQEQIAKLAAENENQIKFVQNSTQEAIENLRQNYQNQLKNLIETYEDKEKTYREELEDLRDKRNKATLAAIQEYEKNNQNSFYKLQLTDDNLADIKVLHQIQPLLHNSEILGKLIYKTYYEKPFTDLVGRVLNKEEFSGIYKITNELNQKCYVGQAVNIKKRWQQHIKRAVGAEPLVNNKLYPAMIKDGVENFSFEVIDRCEKEKLNEREQYWQEFYQAKSFGYSIK